MNTRAPTTLADLIRAFMEYAQNNYQETFPALDGRLWHELFYSLQMGLVEKVLILQEMGPFTANGGYPTNKKLSEAMKEIAPACNTHYDTGRVVIAVPLKNNQVKNCLPGLIETIYATASEIEGFFEK